MGNSRFRRRDLPAMDTKPLEDVGFGRRVVARGDEESAIPGIEREVGAGVERVVLRHLAGGDEPSLADPFTVMDFPVGFRPQAGIPKRLPNPGRALPIGGDGAGTPEEPRLPLDDRGGSDPHLTQLGRTGFSRLGNVDEVAGLGGEGEVARLRLSSPGVKGRRRHRHEPEPPHPSPEGGASLQIGSLRPTLPKGVADSLRVVFVRGDSAFAKAPGVPSIQVPLRRRGEDCQRQRNGYKHLR